MERFFAEMRKFLEQCEEQLPDLLYSLGRQE